MKLHADRPAGHRLTGYGEGYVEVDGTRHEGSLILADDALLTGWAPDGFEALGEADFAPLLGLAPELVLFGSGPRQRFPRPEILRPLIAAGIGVETMDTRAACRTYNILVAEGRKVVAALLIQTP